MLSDEAVETLFGSTAGGGQGAGSGVKDDARGR